MRWLVEQGPEMLVGLAALVEASAEEPSTAELGMAEARTSFAEAA